MHTSVIGGPFSKVSLPRLVVVIEWEFDIDSDRIGFFMLVACDPGTEPPLAYAVLAGPHRENLPKM